MSLGTPTSKDHGTGNAPTTASITISAGDLVTIICNDSKPAGKGAPAAASVTSGTGGFTSSGWTTQIDQAATRSRLTVLSQRFSSGITGTITLSLNSTPGTGTYDVVVTSGTDATTPIPNVAKTTNTSANASVSLAGTPASGNIVIAAFSSTAGFTVGSGFTLLNSQTQMLTEYEASNVQTATVTNTSQTWCGGILEIAAPAAAATLSVSPTTIISGQTGITLTLTGTGTSWTPGTPGSPTFTIT